ncbi:unnamed protein product [Euphydryas editha]|uniref:Tc1-like transposase DDE domain-containing protein n=2 Tax=Euphydryas editha TaxID=104508 RepID=A0AAU9TCS3_EUPED|nr:unnamed protein product [Euphydryas editha]
MHRGFSQARRRLCNDLRLFWWFRCGRYCENTGNEEGYKNILKNNVVPSEISLIGPEFVFQHDNDPKHTSKLCKQFLEAKENQKILKVMQWPPQSPDLNSIELLWNELDRQVRKFCPTSEHLWRILQNEWRKITPFTLEKLVARLPNICQAVIKSRGGHIDESKF